MRHHDGVSDKGRASVSAVQDFISRVRQGLGVAPGGEDLPADEEEAEDSVDVAVTEAAPEEQALVAAAANGTVNGTTALNNGAPGPAEQPVTS